MRRINIRKAQGVLPSVESVPASLPDKWPVLPSSNTSEYMDPTASEGYVAAIKARNSCGYHLICKVYSGHYIRDVFWHEAISYSNDYGVAIPTLAEMAMISADKLEFLKGVQMGVCWSGTPCEGSLYHRLCFDFGTERAFAVPIDTRIKLNAIYVRRVYFSKGETI